MRCAGTHPLDLSGTVPQTVVSLPLPPLVWDSPSLCQESETRPLPGSHLCIE